MACLSNAKTFSSYSFDVGPTSSVSANGSLALSKIAMTMINSTVTAMMMPECWLIALLLRCRMTFIALQLVRLRLNHASAEHLAHLGVLLQHHLHERSLMLTRILVGPNHRAYEEAQKDHHGQDHRLVLHRADGADRDLAGLLGYAW